MTYSISEKISIATQFSILGLLVLFLYLDLNRRIKVEGEKVIGSITFKQRTVQRKYAAHVVWEDLDQNFPLHNKDSIRTAGEADAELTLNDGTKINLSENSMILLDLTDDKTNIDFAYGSVSAKNDAEGGGSSKLNIKSGETSISLGNGDVKLSKTENQDLNVSVQKGEAEISSAGKDAQKIGKDEKVVLGINSDKIEVKKVELKLLSPPDNARYFSSESAVPVAFEIQKDNTTTAVKLEIASSGEFKKITSSKKISDNQATVSLKEGVYYWRTVSGKEISQTRRLTVIQNRAVNLIAPSNGFHTPALHETMYISFSWSKNDLAANYKLDVAATSDFSSGLQSSVVTTNFVSVSLPKGKYFWRVGASVPSGNGQSVYLNSNVNSFEIRDQEKGKSPTLFNPAQKSVIYSVLAEKKGLPFNWSTDQQMESYEFLLSNSPKFEQISLKKLVATNYFEIREKLSPGKYFWKVMGKTKDGRETEFSSVSFFEIKDVNTFKIFSPETSASFNLPDVISGSLAFNWEKLPILGKYVLQISDDQNFKNIRKNFTVPNNRYVLKEIEPGTYFWRVSFLTEAGESLLVTNSNSFSVRYLPEDPKLVLPKLNSSFIGIQKSFKFQWTKGNVSKYELHLYQRLDDKRKEVFIKEVNTNEYIAEEALDVGTYEWTVVSLGAAGERSKEIHSRFIVNPEPEKVEIQKESAKSISLLYPKEGQSINVTKLESISFKWIPHSGIKKYKFSIHDGIKEIFSTETSGATYKFSKLSLLDAKEFKWSVIPITTEPIAEEKFSSFRIELDPIKEEIEVLSPDVQYGD